MAPNNNSNNFDAASADTPADDEKITHTNDTGVSPFPNAEPAYQTTGSVEDSSADSKLRAAASSNHITSTSSSALQQQQQHLTPQSHHHPSHPSNHGHPDYTLPTVHDKRKLPSAAATAEPDTEAGLELLFAASLIQQNDESNKHTPPDKAISSCSENESIHGDSSMHTAADLTESAGVLEPSERDVLLGRGGKINKHNGNVVYRKVVDYNKAIYKQVPKRHRILVSQSIVQTIEKHGGRFLQPVSGQGKQNRVWKCIQFRRAVQKTSQALREPSTETLVENSAADEAMASSHTWN